MIKLKVIKLLADNHTSWKHLSEQLCMKKTHDDLKFGKEVKTVFTYSVIEFEINSKHIIISQLYPVFGMFQFRFNVPS